MGKIKVGIITVPAQNAQVVANHMIAGGIKSILNFAPAILTYPHNIKIDTIDISIELERLVYFLTSKKYEAWILLYYIDEKTFGNC